MKEPEPWTDSLAPAHVVENLIKYIQLGLQRKKEGSSFPFNVLDKKGRLYAGSTRFYGFQPKHKTEQLSYTWYGKYVRGTGLNKNYKYLLLQRAFEFLHLERVAFRAVAKTKEAFHHE